MIKIGRRPKRAISKEAGRVASITQTNCSDSGKVAIHNDGANIAPARPVLMILIFITLMDRPCAMVIRHTVAGIEAKYFIIGTRSLVAGRAGKPHLYLDKLVMVLSIGGRNG